MGMHLVSAGSAGAGVWSLATSRNRNRLDFFDGRGWAAATEWDGPEATALAMCGGSVVVSGVEGVVWIYRDGQLVRITHEHREFWAEGGAALDADVVLLGGSNGGTSGLMEVSLTAGTVTPRKLSELGVSKPGRMIWNVVRAGAGPAARVLVLGERNLAVEYARAGAKELLASPRETGMELLVQYAAEWRDSVWIGGVNPHPFVATLSAGRPEFVEVALGPHRAPALLPLGDELVVGGNGLFIGEPGAWRTLIAPGEDESGTPVAAFDGWFLVVTGEGASRRVFPDGRIEESRVW